MLISEILHICNLTPVILKTFLKYIFEMGVNRKFDFKGVWKFCWDLCNIISGGTLYPPPPPHPPPPLANYDWFAEHCFANQCPCFYLIGSSIMKELSWYYAPRYVTIMNYAKKCYFNFHEQLFIGNNTLLIILYVLYFSHIWAPGWNLMLLSAVLYQNFIFSSNDSPSKTMKNVFCFHIFQIDVMDWLP